MTPQDTTTPADTALTVALMLALVVLWTFLGLSVAGCDDGERLYWQPDLAPFECSKSLKTCEPGVEMCFEGSCVPTCFDHDECPDGHFCAGVAEEFETLKICWREP